MMCHLQVEAAIGTMRKKQQRQLALQAMLGERGQSSELPLAVQEEICAFAEHAEQVIKELDQQIKRDSVP